MKRPRGLLKCVGNISDGVSTPIGGAYFFIDTEARRVKGGGIAAVLLPLTRRGCSCHIVTFRDNPRGEGFAAASPM